MKDIASNAPQNKHERPAPLFQDPYTGRWRTRCAGSQRWRTITAGELLAQFPASHRTSEFQDVVNYLSGARRAIQAYLDKDHAAPDRDAIGRHLRRLAEQVEGGTQ